MCRLQLILLAFIAVGPQRPGHAQAIERDARSGALADATTALNDVPDGPDARGSLSLTGGQSFGLPELRFARIRYAQDLPIVALILEGGTFGSAQFRTSSLALAAAREFRAPGPRSFHLTAGARYVYIGLRGYGSADAIGLSVGIRAQLTPELDLAFRAANINAPGGEAGRTLPRMMAVGFQYQPDERARIFVDVAKDVLHPVAIRTGIELELAAPLHMRCGFATKPSRVAGGFGVSIGSTSIDMVVQRHGDLGWSQAASLSLTW